MSTITFTRERFELGLYAQGFRNIFITASNSYIVFDYHIDMFPFKSKRFVGKYKDDMSEDVLHRVRRQTYNETLIMMEDMCSLMANKVLSCLGMTASNRHTHDSLNHELQREQQYDTEALAETVHTNVPQLNQQQRIA